MSLSCTYLRYSEILVENRRLNIPHLYLTPPLGVTPLEFRLDFWHQRTKSPWAIVRRCLRDSTLSHSDTNRRVTDGQTDGQTDRQTDTRRQRVSR